MKTITLWQPWATWIALGWKKIETRTHNRLAGLAGQRIAIHAGKKFDPGAFNIARPYMSAERMKAARTVDNPSGKVVCTAMVAEARPLTGRDSAAALVYCTGGALWGLVLRDIELVDPPQAATGHQRIWNWQPNDDISKGTDMAATKAKTTKKAKRKGKKKGQGQGKKGDGAAGGVLAGDELKRVYGEHQVVEEREQTLLETQEDLKQAKADLTEAGTRLVTLLIDCDVDRGDEVVHARADVRDRARIGKKANEAVAEAKAGLKEAWGVINNLIDEKIDGLPLIDGSNQ